MSPFPERNCALHVLVPCRVDRRPDVSGLVTALGSRLDHITVVAWTRTADAPLPSTVDRAAAVIDQLEDLTRIRPAYLEICDGDPSTLVDRLSSRPGDHVIALASTARRRLRMRAQRVADRCDVHLAVVPPVTTVILAMNGSPACRRAVLRAARLFSQCEFVVARVVPEGTAQRGPHRATASSVRAAADAILLDEAEETLATVCDALGSLARPVLLEGDPAVALSALARTEEASAIVVGSLGTSVLRALRASVGDDLLTTVPCSVVELGR